MARISGINLPPNKRIEIALTYLYGIGRSLSHKILTELKIDLNTKVKDMSDPDVIRLRDAIAKIPIEDDLRRKIQLDIKRLMEINAYRGIRHRKKLPVRGQRTRKNARTRKGRKKTVAGKKKIIK